MFYHFHCFSYRTREELVKVIAQLKSGEDVCPLSASNSNVNEDSSSAEVPPQLEVKVTLTTQKSSYVDVSRLID